MKDIFMSPILYTVIGVLLNTIIIYVKNYKEAKAMQGTCSTSLGFMSTGTRTRPSCPAGRSSALPLPAPSFPAAGY